MRDRLKLILFLGLVALVAGCGGSSEQAEEAAAPAAEAPAAAEQTPDEIIAGLDAMCDEAAPAIAARQAEASLYDRVGGREGIEAMFSRVMALHDDNEVIAHMFEGVDTASVVEHATDFMVIGAGGEAVYEGREIVALHADMGIGNAEFLAAGADFQTAMTELGWGEGEQQEIMCMLLGARAAVMTK